MPRLAKRTDSILQIRIPVEWRAALEAQAIKENTTITEIVRPHIRRVVEAIVTMNVTDKAA